MSYSRWIESAWYTYWGASKAKTKNDENFCVAACGQARYGDMRKDFDGVLAMFLAGAMDPENNYGVEHVTEAQKEELAGYMREFMEDVERVYGQDATLSHEEVLRRM